jgi:hypothetical protein
MCNTTQNLLAETQDNAQTLSMNPIDVCQSNSIEPI